MNPTHPREITGLLKAWDAGDPCALERPDACGFRRVETHGEGEGWKHLKLVEIDDDRWQDRAHFLPCILVDTAQS